MKQKTSVTLSSDVLDQIDRIAGKNGSRSAYIDEVLRSHLERRARDAMNARDIELINANADDLNREAMDVLRYRAPLD